MKGLFGAHAALVAALFLAPALAGAQPVLQQRCNADSLDPTAAEVRLNWARRCALVNHIMNPANWFDTGVGASNGGTLRDYTESDVVSNWTGANAYTGQNDNFEVNSSFIGKLYNNGATSQATDGDGYFGWSRIASRKKPRPLYPTFGSEYDIYSGSNVQLFPHPSLANCTLYKDKAGTQPATTSFYVNGYCESSCYTPEQRVLFGAGNYRILDAVNQRREDVVTLDSSSTLDNIQLKRGSTYSYTAEFRDTEHPIVEITTESGGLLRVTTEHPVVNGEGRLVTAKELRVGDQLVKVDGTMDAIVNLNRTTHFGKVYNLRPNTDDRVSNVLVAEGYLVGSSLFQNDQVEFINSIILYKQVPPDAIP